VDEIGRIDKTIHSLTYVNDESKRSTWPVVIPARPPDGCMTGAGARSCTISSSGFPFRAGGSNSAYGQTIQARRPPPVGAKSRQHRRRETVAGSGRPSLPRDLLEIHHPDRPPLLTHNARCTQGRHCAHRYAKSLKQVPSPMASLLLPTESQHGDSTSPVELRLR
jgi:hypothetical protein